MEQSEGTWNLDRTTVSYAGFEIYSLGAAHLNADGAEGVYDGVCGRW